MTQIFPIHAYLSYRCRNDIDITARDHLASLCQQQHITLKYDENETKDGDSLIAFMAELTSARVVFIFLSPAYFQSAYTLFELVTIAEQAEIDKRFILPIRLTESMNTYQLTEAKEYFDNNIKISNELARLLTTEANPEQLWQRIDKAWQALIFPVLDKVSLSFENQEEPAVTQLLKNTQEEITAAIKRSTTELQQTLIQKITSILELNNINADAQWQEELGLSTNNNKQNIAKQLIENTEVGEALAIITRIVEEKDRRSADWIACIEDAIQLASWCLLNSVDPVWWFHQQIRLKNTSKISIINQVTLNNENYIEVVIARSLLQKPEYVLDKNF